MEQYTLLRCSMTRTIICCIPQIYPYITNDRGPYRIGHCTRYTPPAGLEDATPPARLATTPTHVPCTEAGSLPFRACPPRGTTGLQPVVKRRGGPAVVRAIAPHTDSRGRTTLGLPMRRHMQHGEGGDRAGPILGPPCGDNRQTHLGGRGPPGCSGERDRWLPLGSDDFNARTQV
jgi:hypothetical protein